jgi:hypothetical protein
MITPTIFVGLGTTGTNILKNLRELMAEEYGHAGLPLFRYIAIETHGEVNVQNTNQMDDYERINLIRATIPSVKPIDLKLTPGEPLHNPHLADWLDRELLKIEASGFMDGASNIRMAGRLCLWENWANVQSTFANAIGAIMAPATKRKTIDILTERNKIEGHPLDDTGSIKVYVLGSLCGGSCSGMLIDVGYFFRYLLSAYGDKSINGIFTMFDETHAANPDAMFNIRSANCYASLLELNYYHHQETTYDVTFPDGRKIEHMRERPFDYTLFVSPSGKSPGNQFSTEAGDFDEHGLNLMVALNLFAESAADTGGEKDAIRTNYTAHTNFGTLKPVRQGEIRTMIRYMASFGLTAVWYPKYRIASAAACSISNKLCESWLGSRIPQAMTVRDAETEWHQILSANIDTLTNPEGQLPINSRIDTHLANARQQWLNTEISSNRLSQSMENFPAGDSFRKKFEQGGEYVELMKMQVSECKKAFRDAIEQTLNNQLGSIDFGGTQGLGDVKMFFETLDKSIENSIQNCPDRMPTLNLDKLDFSAMERADNNLWLKLIFLRDDSVEAHRKNMVEQYCNSITARGTGFYESVRNHFIRPILQEIRSELGFGVIPKDEGEPNRRRTIKQRLDQIEGNLNKCIQEFKNEYNEAINPPRSECVKIVANNAENRIDTDAATLSHQISQSDDGIELLRGESMATFLAKEQTDIIAQMTETYRQLSLDRIQVDDVITKAQELLDSGSSDIQNLASRSNPYQMFTDTYRSFVVEDSPNIIFGHVGKALTDLNNSLSGKEFSFEVSASSVDHLLFFYQEEAGFALDDLVSHDTLADKYRQSPGEYGHSTHQDADFYNLELYDKIQKLQDWCRALGKIVPEICHRINKDAFSGVFYQTQNGYVYEYNVDGLSERLGLHNDPGGIKSLSQKRNETEYNKFMRLVRSCFTDLDRKQIQQLINSLLREIEGNNEHRSISQFFRQFLDDVYSEDASIDNTGSNSATGSTFFQTPPQTHQPELDNTSTPPTQDFTNENAETPTANSDDYGGTATEESDIDAGSFNQPDTEHNEVGATSPQNTALPQDSADTTYDEYVWTEAEPEIEPTIAGEATGEETVSEQQPQSETDEQKKQAQPSKAFDVADVDLKKVLSRDSAPKKE